ncbi:hypothetical protein PLICRDRAFT_35835 [Plicaturopsis crispa FD-325 SS-3]|nr:hypothetical protein PLICRDRAFT_35835 [Plicaturopsis crispa FD-325 SS-3]
MPPIPTPPDHPSLHLYVLPNDFFVIKLKPGDSSLEAWTRELLQTKSEFLSITRTREEISISGDLSIAAQDIAPSNANWRCIKIAGPMEFDLTGVVASFTAPLKDSGVGVFVLSTWNTDYILVPKDKLELAENSLRQNGWVVKHVSDAS